MATLDELRPLYPDATSDADLIRRAAEELGEDPAAIAQELKFVPRKSGSMTSERVSSAIDQSQAGLYGVAEEAFKGVGLDRAAKWAQSGRQDNTFRAGIADQRAGAKGAISRWTDDPNTGVGGVHGVGDAANYVGGQLINMAPQVATTVAGGIVGGLATGGNPIGAAVGAFAAATPQYMGSNMQAQREQTATPENPEGTTAPGAALGWALPQAGIDILSGGTGRILGAVNKTAKPVAGGLMRRGAVEGLKTGAEEAAGEVGQQYGEEMSRAAVDPTHDVFGAAAQDRYKESAIGGAVVGGGIGAVSGAAHREKPPAPKPTVDQNPDLLNQPPAAPLQLGYDLGASGAGGVIDPNPIAVTAEGQAIYGPAAADARQNFQLLERNEGGLQPPPPATTWGDYPPEGMPAQPPVTVPAQQMDPNFIGFGNEDPNAPHTADPTDPQRNDLARVTQMRNDQEAQDVLRQDIAERTKILDDQKARAEGFGIKGLAGVKLMVEVEEAAKSGSISPEDAKDAIAEIAARRLGEVRRKLKESREFDAAEANKAFQADLLKAAETPASNPTALAGPAPVAEVPKVGTVVPKTEQPAPVTTQATAPVVAKEAPRTKKAAPVQTTAETPVEKPAPAPVVDTKVDTPDADPYAKYEGRAATIPTVTGGKVAKVKNVAKILRENDERTTRLREFIKCMRGA